MGDFKNQKSVIMLMKLKREDKQFLGFILVIIGLMLVVTSPPSFIPLTLGGAGGIISLAGIIVLWYGFRK